MRLRKNVLQIVLYGMLIALAFVFSYIEVLIPINIGIPGVKLGLGNLVVLIALYTLGTWGALVISVIRILLTALTFGNLFSMLYSLAGGLLSFTVMALLKKSGRFQIGGVSICGGVCHNIGQLLVAMVVLETGNVWYYFPFLLISGAVTGTLIGFVGGLVVEHLINVLKIKSKK